jgi:hypothetical protein
MMKMECAYCKKLMIEGIHAACVSRLYGIMHCEEHTKNAQRDIHLYMDKRQVVRMRDTYKHPKLKPLFDILRSGVTIRRSNGNLDPEWKILDDPYDSPNIIKKQEEGWMCPMKKEMSLENDIHKLVPLESLFAELDPASEQRTHLATALKALSDGIYSTSTDYGNTALQCT